MHLIAFFELIVAVSVDKNTIYVDFDINLKWGTMATKLTEIDRISYIREQRINRISLYVFKIGCVQQHSKVGRLSVWLCRPHGRNILCSTTL